MANDDNPRASAQIPGLEFFLALETRVWDALVAGDAEADGALLTPDFLGVYPSGFSGRDGHTGQLDNGPVMASYHLDQARVMPVGADHAMLCYRATYRRAIAGTGQNEVMYISSLWGRTKDGWLNSFSQDTPAP